MRVEHNVCDRGDCDEFALYQITHRRLSRFPIEYTLMGERGEATTDLCARHAQQVAITGNGRLLHLDRDQDGELWR